MVLTLFVILLVVAVLAAVAIGFGGFGPRVIRRTTVIERPARRVVEEVPVRRRYVEDDTL